MDSNQSPQNLNSKDVARGTFVATPEGDMPIEYFSIGDEVLTYAAHPESGKIKLKSSKAKISFSEGVLGSEKLIKIDLEDTYRKSILASPDQPFLLIEGKYIQAGRLRRTDKLVNGDGNPVKIANIRSGNYNNGYHAIATDVQGHSISGHLLLINDIIAGDHILQKFFDHLPEQLKL